MQKVIVATVGLTCKWVGYKTQYLDSSLGQISSYLWVKFAENPENL